MEKRMECESKTNLLVSTFVVSGGDQVTLLVSFYFLSKRKENTDCISW